MSATTNAGLGPLIGSWRLRSAGLTFTDTGERVEPWGAGPDGRMVLEPGGRIMFLFTRRGREPAGSEAERAVLFETMMAYTGLARSGGPGRFITAVDVAGNPRLRGDQLRLYRIEANLLHISTEPQTSSLYPGRLTVADVVFEQEHPPAV